MVRLAKTARVAVMAGMPKRTRLAKMARVRVDENAKVALVSKLPGLVNLIVMAKMAGLTNTARLTKLAGDQSGQKG